MDIIVTLGGIGLILLIVVIVFIGRTKEKKKFNIGVCPKCDLKLKYFDVDSSKARGWICDKCGYIIWVSFGSVDEGFVNTQT